MKVSNVCRYLIALLTAQSQGIDPVDEVLLHLSCLQTTALSLTGLKITISRSLGIVLTSSTPGGQIVLLRLLWPELHTRLKPS